jgi:hypothetical protein
MHPAAAFTLTVRLPPFGSTVWLRGDTSKPQPGDCVTVSTWPAIVTVPLRDGPVVAATAKPTLPLPVPDVVVSVTQFTSLDAVHGQPGAAVTVAVFDPPAAPAAYADGAIAKVQPSDCVTLKCSPAIVRPRARTRRRRDLMATTAEPLRSRPG